ncbi:MAG: PotD/PotF family extracellular solute-binding protein [Dongiaceae bacterium]
MADITPKQLKDALARGRMTRRQALQALASVGIGVAALPVLGRRAAAAPNLIYFTWSGYDDPQYQAAFVEKYGGPPEYAIFGEEEEGLQRIRSGFRADIAHACTSNVQRWKDAAGLKPIDVSRLQHWPDIYPAFQELDGVKIDGEIYNVPWEWGNSSIAYRPDLVEPKEQSFNLLLDERYKGRMAAFDNSEEVPVYAALIAGVADPFHMNDADLAKVREIMEKMNGNMRFYWTDYTQANQAFASGEIVASMAWNDMVKTMHDEGVPIAYMTPKEGILTWVCGMSLLKDGPGDEQQAYDFIDAMIAPETGALVMENFYYGHSNRKALEVADPELVATLDLADAEARIADPNTHFFSAMSSEQREKLNAMFEEVKAGL